MSFRLSQHLGSFNLVWFVHCTIDFFPKESAIRQLLGSRLFQGDFFLFEMVTVPKTLLVHFFYPEHSLGKHKKSILQFDPNSSLGRAEYILEDSVVNFDYPSPSFLGGCCSFKNYGCALLPKHLTYLFPMTSSVWRSKKKTFIFLHQRWLRGWFCVAFLPPQRS